MIYLFTNITDGSSDPKDIYVGDIDGIQSIRAIKPGESINFEDYATRNQICVSHHIRVHVLEGRATVEDFGTVPDPNCRVWVNAKLEESNISIGEVSIEEPLQISVDIDGVETPVTGTQCGDKTFADVNPLLPNIPEIQCLDIPSANTEVPLVLPTDSTKFMVMLEEDGYNVDNLQMGFVSGGPTITIPCGTNFVENSVNASDLTLYFKTKKAPQVVKVLSWSCG